MLTIRLNTQVKTPLGKGVVQGAWAGASTGSATRVLVRVNVSQANEKAIPHSLTPRAKKSALFAFALGELGAV